MNLPNPWTPMAYAQKFRRDLLIDQLIYWMIILASPLLILFLGNAIESTHVFAFLVLFTFGSWLWVSSRNAKAWQQANAAAALFNTDMAQAESLLWASLKQRPLHRPIRLVLLHRLAFLKHRQGQFIEVGIICDTILTQPMTGHATKLRAQTLMIRTEAALACHDLLSAYYALSALAEYRQLSLTESLQRMTLLTRYLIASGHDALAIESLHEKISLIELMPSPQCGMMHFMLSISAKRIEYNELACWLEKRAKLLCTPKQLQQVQNFEPFNYFHSVDPLSSKPFLHQD